MDNMFFTKTKENLPAMHSEGRPEKGGPSKCLARLYLKQTTDEGASLNA